MNSSAWWAKKLGGGAPQQPTYPAPPPAYAPVPQPAQVYAQPQPQPQPQPMAQPGVQTVVMPGNGGLPSVAYTTKGTAAGWVSGSVKELQALGPCPSCGSAHYMSRASGVVTKADGTRCMPAPICNSCGYNSLYPSLQGTANDAIMSGQAMQFQAPNPQQGAVSG